jgi:hypothetical protein
MTTSTPPPTLDLRSRTPRPPQPQPFSPDPRGTPPASWPPEALEAEAVRALAAELRTRGRGVSFLERQQARMAAWSAVNQALAYVPPHLHREARRDWTAQAEGLAGLWTAGARARQLAAVPRRRPRR